MSTVSGTLFMASYFAACHTTLDPSWRLAWCISTSALGVVAMALAHHLNLYATAFTHGVRCILDVALILIFSQSIDWSRLSPSSVPVEYICLIPVVVCLNACPFRIPPGRTAPWDLCGLLLVLGWGLAGKQETQATVRLHPLATSASVAVMCAAYATHTQNRLQRAYRMGAYVLMVYITYVKMPAGVEINALRPHNYYVFRNPTNVDYTASEDEPWLSETVLKALLSILLRAFLLLDACAEFSQLSNLLLLRTQAGTTPHKSIEYDRKELILITSLSIGLVGAVISSESPLIVGPIAIPVLAAVYTVMCLLACAPYKHA
jgi:hypothetical protein